MARDIVRVFFIIIFSLELHNKVVLLNITQFYRKPHARICFLPNLIEQAKKKEYNCLSIESKRLIVRKKKEERKIDRH